MSLCDASIEYAAMMRSLGEINCVRYLHEFKESARPSQSTIYCECGAAIAAEEKGDK